MPSPRSHRPRIGPNVALAVVVAAGCASSPRVASLPPRAARFETRAPAIAAVARAPARDEGKSPVAGHPPPGAERLLKGYEAAEPSDGPLPYGYALSLGTPMYGRVPTTVEQKRTESIYGPPPIALGAWAKGHDGLASADPVRADDELPW